MDNLLAGNGIAPEFPPAQLEIRTAYEPTVFPSLGRHHLIYELHLLNFGDRPIALDAIEALDADSYEPFACLQRHQLDIRTIGTTHGESDPQARRILDCGRRAVAFVFLSVDADVGIPGKLRHRIVSDARSVVGPAIATRSTALRVLGAPVEGPGWTAVSGPGNDSHHRTGVFVVDGVARISRRYAIDWKKIRDGASFLGDARDVRCYHTYGENVIAVADGTVVAAVDGLPDNVPRTRAGFEPAVPTTMATIAGNSLTIDLGHGQFAFYAHLQAHSLRVATGDRVRCGQPLARVGNSGDAREPHLHFQVADAPDALAAEGLPYLIDRYRLRLPDGRATVRTQELPLAGMRVDF